MILLKRPRFPGFRPMAMILFALIWFSVGLGLITRPDALEAAHRLPIEYLPVWLRVVLWWVPAAIGVVLAFKWPKYDRWAWVIMSLPASFRVISYSLAAMLGWIDITFSLSWLVICGILTLIAAWPEPPEVDHVD